jgi:hypothetical protein
MPIWKDKSGLHGQADHPSIVEEKLNQLNALERSRRQAPSWALQSYSKAQGKLIRELGDLGVNVAVDRERPGFRVF